MLVSIHIKWCASWIQLIPLHFTCLEFHSPMLLRQANCWCYAHNMNKRHDENYKFWNYQGDYTSFITEIHDTMIIKIERTQTERMRPQKHDNVQDQLHTDFTFWSKTLVSSLCCSFVKYTYWAGPYKTTNNKKWENMYIHMNACICMYENLCIKH